MTDSKAKRARNRKVVARERNLLQNINKLPKVIPSNNEIENLRYVEAEQQMLHNIEVAKFKAEQKGEKLEIGVFSGFLSKFDPFTRVKFAWEFWLKLPFSISVNHPKYEQFKEAIQDAFEEIFLR